MLKNNTVGSHLCKRFPLSLLDPDGLAILESILARIEFDSSTHGLFFEQFFMGEEKNPSVDNDTFYPSLIID